MRFLVVVTGLVLGLSGCVGGIVHRMPVGNETAEPFGTDAETPPWLLNSTDARGAKGADAHNASFDNGVGDGQPKQQGPADAPADKDPADEDPGDDGPADEPAPSDGDAEKDPLEQVQDESPTQGAAGTEDAADGIEDTVNDGTSAPSPKDPLADEPLPEPELKAPTSSGTSGAKSIPTTQTKLV